MIDAALQHPILKSDNRLRWYVAHVAPRQEELAISHLARQGFETFCPQLWKERRHARQRKVVKTPVFPGYLFVRFDIDSQPWVSINSTRGVRHLVGPSPSRPQSFPDSAMGLLQTRCNEGILRHSEEQLTPGQRIRVSVGPFIDRIATIERLEAKDRVRVLFSMLGKEQSISLPVDIVMVEPR
jgi:transcriptional antiterminator RfaH